MKRYLLVILSFFLFAACNHNGALRPKGDDLSFYLIQGQRTAQEALAPEQPGVGDNTPGDLAPPVEAPDEEPPPCLINPASPDCVPEADPQAEAPPAAPVAAPEWTAPADIARAEGIDELTAQLSPDGSKVFAAWVERDRDANGVAIDHLAFSTYLRAEKRWEAKRYIALAASINKPQFLISADEQYSLFAWSASRADGYADLHYRSCHRANGLEACFGAVQSTIFRQPAPTFVLTRNPADERAMLVTAGPFQQTGLTVSVYSMALNDRRGQWALRKTSNTFLDARTTVYARALKAAWGTSGIGMVGMQMAMEQNGTISNYLLAYGADNTANQQFINQSPDVAPLRNVPERLDSATDTWDLSVSDSGDAFFFWTSSKVVNGTNIYQLNKSSLRNGSWGALGLLGNANNPLAVHQVQAFALPGEHHRVIYSVGDEAGSFLKMNDFPNGQILSYLVAQSGPHALGYWSSNFLPSGEGIALWNLADNSMSRFWDNSAWGNTGELAFKLSNRHVLLMPASGKAFVLMVENRVDHERLLFSELE